MVVFVDMIYIIKFLDWVDEFNNDFFFNNISIIYEEFKFFVELRRSLCLLFLVIFSYGKVNGFLIREDF